jgi:DNA-binding XRE family transcriptional regulator
MRHNLQQKREALGLSPEAAAAAMEVTRDTITNWERADGVSVYPAVQRKINAYRQWLAERKLAKNTEVK